MRNYTATALSAVLLGLTIVGVTSEAEASRRKPRRPIVIGEIQQISETFVILNDSRVELTSRTVYQDYADMVISRDAFAAGDCVKVKLIPGRLIPTAKEMEMEDRCTAGSGTGVVKPSPGIAREDKGGCRGDGIDAGRKRDGSNDRRRGRGRGRDDN